MHIRLNNNECGEIICNIEAKRKGTYIPVDVLEGTIIDQCVYNNTWFYLSGNTLQVQEILENVGIKGNGIISTRQYLKRNYSAILFSLSPSCHYLIDGGLFG